MKVRWVFGGAMSLVGMVLVLSQMFREEVIYALFGAGLLLIILGAVVAVGDE